MIYVWVRATLDWADEDAFWSQVDAMPRLRPRVEVWNATLNMPFHLFRHRVREIAVTNHSRIHEAAVREDWDEIPDGARVVPTDDDDWFSPELARSLERTWGDAPGVHWNPLWLGVPADFAHWRYAARRALLPFTPPHWTCDTNNYALVKRPGTRIVAESHPDANEHFNGAWHADVRRVSGRLSINNRTLASQTSLRRTMRRGEIDGPRLLERLRAYKRLYRGWRLQRVPGWSRPYVAMMAELMAEIEPA